MYRGVLRPSVPSRVYKKSRNGFAAIGSCKIHAFIEGRDAAVDLINFLSPLRSLGFQVLPTKTVNFRILLLQMCMRLKLLRDAVAIGYVRHRCSCVNGSKEEVLDCQSSLMGMWLQIEPKGIVHPHTHI